ncbi:RNA polymerase sigma factor SigB [Listeria monocytogenes]|uniref:sigma-70 family RNA polymerase sigma factor n=1 Tax=Listeria monocytogenes TaxID=1639 RepID=UPI000DC25A5F|nr:sigma-70 family RNA polymerase sigma factor [Listeria monocytogenes]RAO88890.1 RNA polymerase sigma factor SigB [Listeria monocytogenes]
MPKVSQPDKEAKEKVYIWIAAYQENGDQDAQYNLVVHYKNLVESIARKYSQGKSFHEDLVQVGNIGLLGAIRRYDATFGKSFEAFAVPTIVGEIKRFLRDKTWSVHVPRRIKELGPKIKNAVEELTRELQSSPQISDIADFIGVTEEEVLDEREQKILQFTFIENRSQKETGELLDISQMHVSRIQRQAIKKLREALQNEEVE